jgi:hypothetical protein
MSESTTSHERIITKVLCGGETGADRAAVDFAVENAIAYGGWVPLNGWAEDFRVAPGLTETYPHFVATQSADVAVRTTLNVRDARATVIFSPPRVTSRGVAQTLDIARALRRPFSVIDPTSPSAPALLDQFFSGLAPAATLNVAGSRESEAPGIYDAVRNLLLGALKYFVTQGDSARE